MITSEKTVATATSTGFELSNREGVLNCLSIKKLEFGGLEKDQPGKIEGCFNA